MINTTLLVGNDFLRYLSGLIGMMILHLITREVSGNVSLVLTGTTRAYIPAFGLHSSTRDPSQYSGNIS